LAGGVRLSYGLGAIPLLEKTLWPPPRLSLLLHSSWCRVIIEITKLLQYLLLIIVHPGGYQSIHCVLSDRPILAVISGRDYDNP